MHVSLTWPNPIYFCAGALLLAKYKGPTYAMGIRLHIQVLASGYGTLL